MNKYKKRATALGVALWIAVLAWQSSKGLIMAAQEVVRADAAESAVRESPYPKTNRKLAGSEKFTIGSAAVGIPLPADDLGWEMRYLATVKVEKEETKAVSGYSNDMSKAPLKDKLEALQAPLEVNVPGAIVVEATAYTARCKGCIGITKTGIDVRKETPKIIAVDPDVIPLGSVVDVWVSGYYWGEYRAEDIGGAIKKNKIDVLHPSKAEADTFGRQTAHVVIKEEGTFGKTEED